MRSFQQIPSAFRLRRTLAAVFTSFFLYTLCSIAHANEKADALASARGLEVSVIDHLAAECLIDVDSLKRSFEIKLIDSGVPLSSRSSFKLNITIQSLPIFVGQETKIGCASRLNADSLLDVASGTLLIYQWGNLFLSQHNTQQEIEAALKTIVDEMRIMIGKAKAGR
jgi:hypothetical protein